MIDAGPQSRARYQVVTPLGQGGMARVLLTVSRGIGGVNKLLVVKELKAELKHDPEFLTMFLDEARIAARLNHPNVVQTYEVSSDGEHPIIVMEYLEGQALTTLLARVTRKAMPLDLHLHVLSQTAAGLHYAHDLADFDGTPLGLVHRDVSPHNVFVTYAGLVKLVDFGIAKAADSAGLTRAGQFKGKVGYAAPEQLGAFDRPIDRRADVFALGVMLWEALAQRRLTLGEPEAAVMTRRREGRDPPIRAIAAGTPEPLARICERAMAFDPDARYATAAELRADIDDYLVTLRRADDTGEAGPRSRPGGLAEDLAALVRTSFAVEREKIRGLVEARVRAIEAGATDTGAPIDLVPAARIDRTGESGSSTVRVAASAATPTAAPSSPARTRALIAGGVAIGVAMTAYQLTRGGHAGEAAASAAASASGEAAAPATVDVVIAAEPAEARLYLDDAELPSNPFRGRMPKDGVVHRLRASAPGYASEQRIVVLDRSLQVDLALRASARPQDAPAPPAPAAPAGRPAAVPAKPAAATGPAPASTPAPGEAMTAPAARKKPRAIDDTF
jgi:serine/threonine-protein kinase